MRRRWHWVLLIAILAGSALWWAQSDVEPETTNQLPEPTPKPAAIYEPPTPNASSAPAVSARSDAGATIEQPPAIIDAGLTEQQRIDETMKRWRDALAPLFRIERSRSNRTTPVIAVSDEGREPTADAGTACEDGVQRRPLRSRGSLDLVIAIDTSGSMIPELKDVVKWLAQLELSLRDKGLDFQLLVVADQRSLERGQKRPPTFDGGHIQVPIGSRDALETLITAAKEGPLPRWHQRLRPGANKHLIVVTDDEAADPRGMSYLQPLLTAAQGTLGAPDVPAFTLHVLGGFQTSDSSGLARADQPLEMRLCPGGVAPGLAYQALAQATGGLRASLCLPASYQALTAALVDWPLSGANSSCVWLVQAGASVLDARALRGSATVLRLYEARSADACLGRHDAYLTSGQVFALCGSSCAALTDAGYDAVELTTRCAP